MTIYILNYICHGKYREIEQFMRENEWYTAKRNKFKGRYSMVYMKCDRSRNNVLTIQNFILTSNFFFKDFEFKDNICIKESTY